MSQGFEYLYLSEQDYKSLPEGTVAASKTVVRPRPPSPTFTPPSSLPQAASKTCLYP